MATAPPRGCRRSRRRGSGRSGSGSCRTASRRSIGIDEKSSDCARSSRRETNLRLEWFRETRGIEIQWKFRTWWRSVAGSCCSFSVLARVWTASPQRSAVQRPSRALCGLRSRSRWRVSSARLNSRSGSTRSCKPTAPNWPLRSRWRMMCCERRRLRSAAVLPNCNCPLALVLVLALAEAARRDHEQAWWQVEVLRVQVVSLRSRR
mmetsp:Transcript_5752/g.13994  ORF Transcript_5752/g.13994 Transcript_5752/m.13994 type:complete len:206 (-) Transcript_5752:229-846(-)